MVLEDADIPVMPMHTIDSLMDFPHLNAVGFFEHVEHPSEGSLCSMKVPSTCSKSQPRVTRQAPWLGDHGMAMVKEAGYSKAEIGELATQGATYSSEVI